MSIIESKFTFFQVQIEGKLLHTAELHQADFGIGPEAFYTVDVIGSEGETSRCGFGLSGGSQRSFADTEQLLTQRQKRGKGAFIAPR